MNDAEKFQPIPLDDPNRQLVVATPDEPSARHISLAGNTYTILLDGTQTGGRYCLIDMHVRSGGGPRPHRHDFEEMFTVLEGEIEVTFRGEKRVVKAGETINVPANAPHAFINTSKASARLLCMCTPPGQEQFFMAVGDLVSSRTAPPPKLTENELAERKAKAEALAPQYRSELL